MLLVHSGEEDLYDYQTADRPLRVNSCGISAKSKGIPHLNDAYFLRRPQGRKDYQLLYVAKGKGDYYLNGAWQTVTAGQTVLYQPEQPQFYLYRAQTPILCKWVHFTGGEAEKNLRVCGLMEEPVSTVGEDMEISGLFDRLVEEMRVKSPCYEELSAALLYELLALAGRRRQMLQDEAGSKARQRLMQAVEHMHYHYGESQSIDDYAARCGMSRYHFAHAFREYLGQSPYAYLTKLRMERARELLADSDLPIAEVAANCGYENPLYFSRAFSRHFQMPPSQYRRKYGISAQDAP